MTSLKENHVVAPFGKHLAANDRKTRDKAIKSLQIYLSSKKDFTHREFLKLWKGLFYCFWMSDKPLVQQALADTLASLVLQMPCHNAIPFVGAFWETMAAEWYGIDRLRLDKYYLLLRKFINYSFKLLAQNEWDNGMMDDYIEIMTAGPLNPTNAKVPDSIRYHIIDVWLEELEKVVVAQLSTLAEDENFDVPTAALMQPMLNLMGRSPNNVVVKRVIESVFQAVLEKFVQGWGRMARVWGGEEVWRSYGCRGADCSYQAPVSKQSDQLDRIEAVEDAEDEAEDLLNDTPPYIYDISSIRTALFATGADPITLDANRRKIYTLYRAFDEIVGEDLNEEDLDEEDLDEEDLDEEDLDEEKDLDEDDLDEDDLDEDDLDEDDLDEDDLDEDDLDEEDWDEEEDPEEDGWEDVGEASDEEKGYEEEQMLLKKRKENRHANDNGRPQQNGAVTTKSKSKSLKAKDAKVVRDLARLTVDDVTEMDIDDDKEGRGEEKEAEERPAAKKRQDKKQKANGGARMAMRVGEVGKVGTVATVGKVETVATVGKVGTVATVGKMGTAATAATVGKMRTVATVGTVDTPFGSPVVNGGMKLKTHAKFITPTSSPVSAAAAKLKVMTTPVFALADDIPTSVPSSKKKVHWRLENNIVKRGSPISLFPFLCFGSFQECVVPLPDHSQSCFPFTSSQALTNFSRCRQSLGRS
ncbi:LOW QUALITY PROTEIN: nucleolar protein,Nop52-domain-containing protein [Jimgerdemannia flammicorona]|uniref:Nucleolar protein,Nop52-domain-containing protein n=1 Tax=Jimgerdemannia flammicorona TaxID=994334 RepID=A0A433DKQ5_9FUNG|nr:LOW QUALITY PROTEIN: nucleolar protein,Nop52-domain-containing protein [Jimgerdemannia flammicorona]